MKTVDAIKNHIPQVLAYYNLPPITGNRHFKGECPLCGKKNKFRIDNRGNRGTWICSCGSGDIWGLLQQTQKKDFVTLAKEIDVLIGNSFLKNEQPKPAGNDSDLDVDELRKKVINKFNSIGAMKGSNAEKYLNNRHITLPSTLENVKYSECERMGNHEYGAIYSLATDCNGKPCYLHRTILDGDKKADIEAPKILKKLQNDNYLNFTKSVAIRLFPVSSTLGIAEGIETALSCYQIYGCNTWSTINATFLKKFIAPAGVNHLIIFADTDRNLTGHSAAFECGHKNLSTIHNDITRVTIRWSERGDFNDVLMQGLKVYEWVGELGN